MGNTRLDIEDETFTWEYDDLNRVTKEIYPDDEYITYSYTVGGKRSEIRLPNGSLQTCSYDTRGRLSTMVHSLGNKTFTYNYNSDINNFRTFLFMLFVNFQWKKSTLLSSPFSIIDSNSSISIYPSA